MILHKREKKLSSGSSSSCFRFFSPFSSSLSGTLPGGSSKATTYPFGVRKGSLNIHNSQDGLIHLRRVGQNYLLPLALQGDSKKKNRVASSSLISSRDNVATIGGQQALTSLFRGIIQQKKIVLRAKQGLRSLFSFSSLPFPPFSYSHFFVRNPQKNEGESDFADLRKDRFKALELHHNPNQKQKKHKSGRVGIQRGVNGKNFIGAFDILEPFFSVFPRKRRSAVFPCFPLATSPKGGKGEATKNNLFRLEKAQPHFKISQFTIVNQNQKGYLAVKKGGSVPPAYFGGKYFYGKDSEAGVFSASYLLLATCEAKNPQLLPPIVLLRKSKEQDSKRGVVLKSKNPSVSIFEKKRTSPPFVEGKRKDFPCYATRRQVGVIFKRKTKKGRTASLIKMKKTGNGLLLYTTPATPERGEEEQNQRLKEEQFFISSPSITKKKEFFEKKMPFQLRSFVGSPFSSDQNSYDFRIAFQNRLIPREYSLETFHRSNQDTCLLHNPAVSEGDWVQSGDLLADCAASSGGELSLGKNILVAYMPWEGYNFEDAILISERLVFEDVYSSIHIERYDIEIRETKYGMETITRNIPELNEKELEHLDSNGVAKLGSWIKEGDVLVGRVTPINKKVQSTYKNLLFTILQTKPESVRDSSLRAPRGMKGKIVNVQRFAHQGELEPPLTTKGLGTAEVIPLPLSRVLRSKKEQSLKATGSDLSNDLLPLAKQGDSKEVGSGPGTEEAQINIVYVYLAEKRKIQVGDKMAGRHGNKGIVSQVLPRQDMPFLANGTPIDMVLNPLGVPSRMNVGQIYECLLGLAAKYLGEHYKIFPFDEKYGPEASRSFVYSKLYEARKKTGSEWLFNPNCPGKTRLFDGRTGDPFDQSVTVGYAYMLKLVHLVDDKIHMRSTGPYSLVTQQPLRGRSKQGGQRLGEMEVWALEGYGAAFTLLEMLTIKSDDMTGRMTLWSNLILNKDLSIGTPESFKVLVCELQALCLDIGIFRVDSVGNLAEIESLTELP